MEDSDVPCSNRFPAGRRANSTNNTEQAICRVCIGNSKVMVNISEYTPGPSISIADMISESTGYTVSIEDSYPQSICQPCLRDIKTAFRIRQTYKRSFRLYCQTEEAVLGTDEEIHTIPGSVSDSSCTNNFECQVKNELVEEGDFEKHECKDSDLDFGSHCEVKVEEDCDSVANAERSGKDTNSESKINSVRSNMTFKFQVGSRQVSRLIHTLDDNQLYYRNRILKNGDTTYICRVKDCRARVYLTNDETKVYVREDHEHHNHSGQDLEIKKIIALNEVKDKCKKFSTTHTQEGAELQIFYDSFKRTLQRKRQPLRRLSRLKNGILPKTNKLAAKQDSF